MVQIYVDDIIFGSTNPILCTNFSNLMTTRFEMSVLQELTFFLGSQITQHPDGIFVNQSKYLRDVLKTFQMETTTPMKTPMQSVTLMGPDLERKSVDQKTYRGIISWLLYFTASSPGIVFVTFLCSLSG